MIRYCLLRLYAFMIGYRFWRYLRDPLQLPQLPFYQDQVRDAEQTTKFVEELQAKARASLTTSGVLLGFSVAVLAALIGSAEVRRTLFYALVGPGRQRVAVYALIGVSLLYVVVLAERIVSAEARRIGYTLLTLSLLASFFWFLPELALSVIASVFPFVPTTWLPRFDVRSEAFPLAGLLLIILSAFFLILSIEFYDSASGWRGGYGRAGAIWRLHLASIASHSALFGIPLALLGASLLLCFIEFWLGCITTVVALVVVTVKTEIERELWDIRPEEEPRVC